MFPDKWQQIKGQLQDSFDDVEFSKEKLNDDRPGEKEIAYFTGPLGEMKLEFVSKPVILDKITHGSRRIGSEVGVKYIYSDTEKSHSLNAFVKKDGQWTEIEAGKTFGL